MPILFILLWGSSYAFIKIGLTYSSPLTFVGWRLFFAFLIVWMIFLYQRQTLPRSWRQIGKICLTGVLLQAFYQIFFFASLYYGVPGGVLTVVLAAQPILTILIYREMMTATQLTGLMLGFFGVVLVVSNNLMTGVITFVGMGCCLLSLLGITYGTILQKKYCSDVPLSTNLLLQYLVSWIAVAVLAFSTGSTAATWSVNFVICLGWVVIATSVCANFLFCTLLKRGQATKVTSLLYALPVFTALMDYFMFNQLLSPLSVLGMSIVLMGLMLVHNAKGLSMKLLPVLLNKAVLLMRR